MCFGPSRAAEGLTTAGIERIGSHIAERTLQPWPHRSLARQTDGSTARTPPGQTQRQPVVLQPVVQQPVVQQQVTLRPLHQHIVRQRLWLSLQDILER